MHRTSRRRGFLARIGLVCLLVAVGLTLGACDVEPEIPGGTGNTLSDTHPDRTWVVLVDLSGSTFANRLEFVKLYRAIVGRVEMGDNLVVYDVSKNSVVDARTLADVSTPRPLQPDSTDTSDTYAAKLAEWNQAHAADLEKEIAPALDPELIRAIETTKTKGSDILGAIRLADRAFSLGAGEPRLVILSDMLLSGDFNLGEQKDPEPGLAWLSAHPEVLTELRGARVLVAGAGGKTSGQFNAVKAFWMEYFRASNAELTDAFYGQEMPTAVLDRF